MSKNKTKPHTAKFMGLSEICGYFPPSLGVPSGMHLSQDCVGV